jgi:hypothetical protein
VCVCVCVLSRNHTKAADGGVAETETNEKKKKEKMAYLQVHVYTEVLLIDHKNLHALPRVQSAERRLWWQLVRNEPFQSILLYIIYHMISNP